MGRPDRYPPRAVQGFFKKDELELLIQRRTTRRLAGDGGDQHQRSSSGTTRPRDPPRSARRSSATRQRKALVVMATGAGQDPHGHRAVRSADARNWAKRVLFLADRTALVKQAVNAFKTHLPDSSPVNLVTETAHRGGRVYVSTYPTMMGLIDERRRTASGGSASATSTWS